MPDRRRHGKRRRYVQRIFAACPGEKDDDLLPM
jgi:hypothetical protein